MLCLMCGLTQGYVHFCNQLIPYPRWGVLFCFVSSSRIFRYWQQVSGDFGTEMGFGVRFTYIKIWLPTSIWAFLRPTWLMRQKYLSHWVALVFVTCTWKALIHPCSFLLSFLTISIRSDSVVCFVMGKLIQVLTPWLGSSQASL